MHTHTVTSTFQYKEICVIPAIQVSLKATDLITWTLDFHLHKYKNTVQFKKQLKSSICVFAVYECYKRVDDEKHTMTYATLPNTW